MQPYFLFIPKMILYPFNKPSKCRGKTGQELSKEFFYKTVEHYFDIDKQKSQIWLKSAKFWSKSARCCHCFRKTCQNNVAMVL